MGKNEVRISLETKEFSQYLESLFSDFSKTLSKVSKILRKEKKAELTIPTEFFSNMNKVSSAMKALSDKNFKLEGAPDYSKLVEALKTFSVAIKGLTIPSEVTLKNFPKIPETKVDVDLSLIVKSIDSLGKLLMKHGLSAKIDNLDQLPVAMSQHAAKVEPAISPNIYNLELIEAGTVYEQELSDPTKGFILQANSDYDIDVKFKENGSTWTIKAGGALDIGGYVPSVFASSAQAGVILQVIEIH